MRLFCMLKLLFCKDSFNDLVFKAGVMSQIKDFIEFCRGEMFLDLFILTDKFRERCVCFPALHGAFLYGNIGFLAGHVLFY